MFFLGGTQIVLGFLTIAISLIQVVNWRFNPESLIIYGSLFFVSLLMVFLNEPLEKSYSKKKEAATN
jgi:hypothetical protein